MYLLRVSFYFAVLIFHLCQGQGENEEPAKRLEGQSWYETNKEINEINSAVVEHVLAEAAKPVSYHVENPVSPFVGRRAELSELKWAQVDQKITVISGPRGVGKSELAKKFAQDFKHDNISSTLWINADNSDTIISSFKDLAVLTGIPLEDKSIPSLIRDVFHNFNSRKTLFIFDNARNDTALVNVLPNFVGGTNIILTSRDLEWNFKTIHLKGFTKEEAAFYVKTVLKTKIDFNVEDNKNDELLSTLGYLPLTLFKVTEYIIEKNILSPSQIFSIDDFLRTLKQEERVKEIVQVETHLEVRPPTDDELENFFKAKLGETVGELRNSSSKIASAAWEGITKGASRAGDFFSNGANVAGREIKDKASVVGQEIKGKSVIVGQQISNIAGEVGNKFKDFFG